jgi:hypothetical protein
MRTVWDHRSRQADRWHIACRDLVSRKAENLVSRVTKHEDMKRRSGERIRNHPSEKEKWQRSRDLANSGVRRVTAQALGTPSREGARSEKKNSHWIWAIGEPSDLHVGSCIGVSR